jgi:hypothetical protein
MLPGSQRDFIEFKPVQGIEIEFADVHYNLNNGLQLDHKLMQSLTDAGIYEHLLPFRLSSTDVLNYQFTHASTGVGAVDSVFFR